MKSHLLTINYDATIEKNVHALSFVGWSEVRDFIVHHTRAKFVGSGHYQNRGDLDFWCDENIAHQIIQFLSLYFDLKAYDVKFILNEVKPKYRSPFTGKLV